MLPFIDLQTQRSRLDDALRRRLDAVLEHCRFVSGPEIDELEEALAGRSGARHVVTCASGTDALVLVLMALELGPGDAVIVPDFTFSATAEAVALVGATPVFVDVHDATLNMTASHLAAGVAAAERHELRPRAVIPVDLYGQPADYTSIEATAADHGLFVFADAAQSFGATRAGRDVGSMGQATATSFFPSKPLGCYGDGGAVFTDDDALAATLRSLRVHGQRDGDKNDNERIGLNARLDTIQAAVLLAKLTVFDEELERRAAAAARYTDRLGGPVTVPHVESGVRSSWAQYTIRTEGRDILAAELRAAGIPTAVYYPRPLHHQEAYAGFPQASDLAVSTHAAASVLSLPMHPYLTEATQDRIADSVLAWAERKVAGGPVAR